MRDTTDGGHPAGVRITFPNCTHNLNNQSNLQPRSHMHQHLICETLFITTNAFSTCRQEITSNWPMVKKHNFSVPAAVGIQTTISSTPFFIGHRTQFKRGNTQTSVKPSVPPQCNMIVTRLHFQRVFLEAGHGNKIRLQFSCLQRHSQNADVSPIELKSVLPCELLRLSHQTRVESAVLNSSLVSNN